MRSSDIEGDGIITTYHHNGDFSGVVQFAAHLNSNFTDDLRSSLLGKYEEFSPRTVEVCVPFEHLKKLVAKWVRQEKISELEQTNPDEILLS